TYFNLPAEAQANFRSYLKKETSFEPGDTIGVDAKKNPIIAQDWAHIANEGLDLSDDPAHLEGTARGLVALMKVANDRVNASEPRQFKLGEKGTESTNEERLQRHQRQGSTELIANTGPSGEQRTVAVRRSEEDQGVSGSPKYKFGNTQA